jgi:hypothetical protein
MIINNNNIYIFFINIIMVILLDMLISFRRKKTIKVEQKNMLTI